MPVATCNYEASPAAPRLARRWVAEVLDEWHVRGGAAAGLLTSELVADAVRRAPSHIDVRVEVAGHALRVDVGDSDGGLVQPGVPDDDIERALRRRVVERLATRWGSQGGRDRTSAWFELAS